LGVLSFTFSLVSLSWNLLNNICALLSRGWSTLPGTNIGALLVINILGHRGRDIVANLLRNIIADLTRLIDIIANLLGDGLTDISLVSGALTVRYFLGVDLGNKRADTPCLLLTVS